MEYELTPFQKTDNSLPKTILSIAFYSAKSINQT